MTQEVRGSDSPLDFDMILPTPRKLMEGQGWYDWRIANWGTKWEVEAHMDTTPDGVEYHFESAWSPPCQVIETLGANFPGLTFDLNYNEPGNCFVGRFRVEQGKITFDECREMSQEEMEEICGY